jgi:hypothetical protein
MDDFLSFGSLVSRTACIYAGTKTSATNDSSELVVVFLADRASWGTTRPSFAPSHISIISFAVLSGKPVSELLVESETSFTVISTKDGQRAIEIDRKSVGAITVLGKRPLTAPAHFQRNVGEGKP